jgi:hypothetical protein
MYNMKKIAYLAVFGIIISGCGKENTFSNDFGSSAFINASMGTPLVAVFDDTVRKNAGGFGPGGWSNYLAFTPGTRVTNIKRNDNLSTIATQNFSYNFGQANTVIIYDTLTVGAGGALSGTLRLMRLNDDLTLPAAGRSHVRFVHAAQNAPAVDVTLLRTSATPNDSVTITNRPYIGPNPSEATVTASSTFSNIPSGTYSVRIKLAGTQTLARTPQNFTLVNGGLYTMVAVGTARGVALQAINIRNL